MSKWHLVVIQIFAFILFAPFRSTFTQRARNVQAMFGASCVSGRKILACIFCSCLKCNVALVIMELQQSCQHPYHPGLFLSILRVPFWPPCSSPGTSLVSAACWKDDSWGNMSAPWAGEERRTGWHASCLLPSLHTYTQNTHEHTGGWWAAVLVLNRKRSGDICLVLVPSYFVCLIQGGCSS